MSLADTSSDFIPQAPARGAYPHPPVKESIFKKGGDLGSLDTAKRPSEFRLFQKHS